MSYTLNWSDDSLKPPFILNNETVDKRTTSLDLTGKDLINWGEYIQEDLLRLLENFASRGIPPRSPTIGQFWYDANSDKLFLWDGVSWKTVFSAIKKPVWITPRKLTSTSNVNIQLEATNATEYNTSNLPSSLNGSGNGVVSGTLTPGVYTFNSNAIAQGISVPKQFELTIKNASKLPIWITPSKITIATMPLSIQFEASNTIKYVLTGGVMPYGTTFNESGLLVGECVNDLYNFTLTAIGEEGSTEKTFELLVNAPPVTTTTTPFPTYSSTTTTTTTTPTPTTYSPIIRFVPSTLTMTYGVETTVMIEVIGMKPNGYFYFNFGDFLRYSNWYTPLNFLRAFGVDNSNVQADINGHWSMNITIPAGEQVYPEGYMIISGFGSRDPSVLTSPDDVLMHVNLTYPPDVSA